MIAPIIITGTTDAGMRWAQLWHPTFKAYQSAPAAPYNMAWMRTGDGQAFGIDSTCPPEWVDVVLGMFEAFRKEWPIVPTHTVTYKFGQPTFTPVAATEDAADAPLELDLGVTL